MLLGAAELLSGCGQDREVRRGASLYAARCAVCHGVDARGGGGASVPGLSKTPADLSVLARQNGGVFPTAQVLTTLAGYREGTQAGRRMAPFEELPLGRQRNLRVEKGRRAVPAATADLLRYLQVVQRP